VEAVHDLLVPNVNVTELEVLLVSWLELAANLLSELAKFKNEMTPESFAQSHENSEQLAVHFHYFQEDTHGNQWGVRQKWFYFFLEPLPQLDLKVKGNQPLLHLLFGLLLFYYVFLEGLFE